MSTGQDTSPFPPQTLDDPPSSLTLNNKPPDHSITTVTALPDNHRVASDGSDSSTPRPSTARRVDETAIASGSNNESRIPSVVLPKESTRLGFVVYIPPGWFQQLREGPVHRKYFAWLPNTAVEVEPSNPKYPWRTETGTGLLVLSDRIPAGTSGVRTRQEEMRSVRYVFDLRHATELQKEALKGLSFKLPAGVQGGTHSFLADSEKERDAYFTSIQSTAKLATVLREPSEQFQTLQAQEQSLAWKVASIEATWSSKGQDGYTAQLDRLGYLEPEIKLKQKALEDAVHKALEANVQLNMVKARKSSQDAWLNNNATSTFTGGTNDISGPSPCSDTHNASSRAVEDTLPPTTDTQKVSKRKSFFDRITVGTLNRRNPEEVGPAVPPKDDPPLDPTDPALLSVLNAPAGAIGVEHKCMVHKPIDPPNSTTSAKSAREPSDTTPSTPTPKSDKRRSLLNPGSWKKPRKSDSGTSESATAGLSDAPKIPQKSEQSWKRKSVEALRCLSTEAQGMKKENQPVTSTTGTNLAREHEEDVTTVAEHGQAGPRSKDGSLEETKENV